MGKSARISQLTGSFFICIETMNSRKSASKQNQKLIILGEELDPKYFPKLSRWALTNPSTLEDQLKSIAEKWHEGNIVAAILALESDLSHQ